MPLLTCSLVPVTFTSPDLGPTVVLVSSARTCTLGAAQRQGGATTAATGAAAAAVVVIEFIGTNCHRDRRRVGHLHIRAQRRVLDHLRGNCGERRAHSRWELIVRDDRQVIAGGG